MNTKEQAIRRIRATGMTIREWAEVHSLSERVVRGVLSGRFKGHYGQSHRAAVLLGMKDGRA